MKRYIYSTLCSACLVSGAHAQEAAPKDIPLGADIVVMGELHDNSSHHLNQAAWVSELQPTAVVFEMLPPEPGISASDLDNKSVDELSEALAWSERGWPDFAMYFPIFEAAQAARIYGADVSRADLSVAIGEGADVAFDGDAGKFLLDLPLALEEQALREDEQDTAHCGLMPSEMLPRMVEAQRLRDAVLARTALDALDKTGGPVAVITGNGHARNDWGVPYYLRAVRPDVSVISIGQLTEPSDAPPFNSWIVGVPDGTQDEDPCDAMR